MAKAKYKIDSFVKFAKDGTENHGAIFGKIERKDGFHYEMDETGETVISETDIIQAFRPIVQREPKAKKTSKSASRSGGKNTKATNSSETSANA